MTNDEPSSLKKKSNGGKNESSVSGSGSGDTVGLRRSARETPSKKNNKSSPSSVSVRKSRRLDHGTPLKNQSAKKKIETESPLRRSERENKFQSKGSKTLEKGSTARGKGVAEQGKKSVEAGQKTSDSKDKKDNSVRENVEEQGKKSVEVGSKRKSGLDARCYRKMFKPLKKAKFSDSAKKKLEISGDSGDSGSDNDAEGQRKDSDGEEVEEDVSKDIDEGESVSGSDVEEKHVNTEKPCEFEGPKHSKVSDTGNQSSPSPRIKAKRNKAEGREVDCAIIGKNKRVHNQEGNLVSNKVSSDGNVSRCNQKGATLGSPVDRSCDKCFRKKRIMAGNNNSVFNLCSILEKDKLNGNNFLDWERNLRIVLRSENKENVLETPIPVLTSASTAEEIVAESSIRQNSVSVTCLMLATMETSLQKRFMDMDAYTIIQQMRNMFQMQLRMERYETSKAILESRLEKGKPVGPYVFNMIGLFENMARLGCPYSQELATDIILHSLHEGFNQFRLNFNMQGVDKSLEELLGMLKTAEQNIGTFETKKDVLVIQKGMGFKKSGSGKKRKQVAKGKGKEVTNPKAKGAASDTECFYCNGLGHWKRNCSKYLEDKKNGIVTAPSSGTKKN